MNAGVAVSWRDDATVGHASGVPTIVAEVTGTDKFPRHSWGIHGPHWESMGCIGVNSQKATLHGGACYYT